MLNIPTVGTVSVSKLVLIQFFKHTEAETKWQSFSRRYFQVQFLEWRCINFDKVLLKFVPKGPINNNPALVQIMAWRRLGDKPLSESIMVILLTHICVTRPRWVNRPISSYPNPSVDKLSFASKKAILISESCRCYAPSNHLPKMPQMHICKAMSSPPNI